MICPKCKEVICVPTHKDFIICPKCNEVIHLIIIPIFDETHDMTERDAEIFFDEINNPSQPNEALKNAALQYKNNEVHD